VWPGFSSGVTLGWGCDIGVDPASLVAWQQYLDPGDYNRLDAVKGLTGASARAALPSVASIAIQQRDADAVLFNYTLANEVASTLEAFPAADQLPDDSFGALVSLVYNRGPGLHGDRRTEMLAIRDDLAAGTARWSDAIVQIANMVRLWPGEPTASNLPGRRLAEAALFARGLRGAGMLLGALLKGDGGDAVAHLQDALEIKADGSFGVQTMVHVWHYQSSNNLPATGVADAGTLHQLTQAG
jgi:GH24 family phage-related lysozyme (muramidase)